MKFETWLDRFYEALASEAKGQTDDDGLPYTADRLRKWNFDEGEFRKQFEAGETPEEAASDEYDAMCV